MSKKLLFAVVIAVVAGNAYAETTTQTVTTQNYVDSQVATKQDKIAGHPTTRYYPNSVITDTTEDGVIEKRLVLAIGNGLLGNVNTWGGYLASGNLATKVIQSPTGSQTDLTETDAANGIVSAEILDFAFERHKNWIDLRQKNKVCVRYIDGAEETSENCLLWNLPD